jgi:hypothetical protein
MATYNDMCKAPLEIAKGYILYRNRLIDSSSITSFRTKGKRLMINSYKQNTSHPTMLVMFSSKEDAQLAFDGLKDALYTPSVSSRSSSSEDNMNLIGMLLGIGVCALLSLGFRCL